MPTLASSPASISVRIARSRWRGGAVPGSVRRQMSWSRVGIENVIPTFGSPGGVGQDVHVAHDQRAAGDEADRRAGLRERCDGAAGQAEAALGGLVRVGGRADDHLFALPRSTASSRRRTSTRLVLTRMEVP